MCVCAARACGVCVSPGFDFPRIHCRQPAGRPERARLLAVAIRDRPRIISQLASSRPGFNTVTLPSVESAREARCFSELGGYSIQLPGRQVRRSLFRCRANKYIKAFVVLIGMHSGGRCQSVCPPLLHRRFSLKVIVLFFQLRRLGWEKEERN